MSKIIVRFSEDYPSNADAKSLEFAIHSIREFRRKPSDLTISTSTESLVMAFRVCVLHGHIKPDEIMIVDSKANKEFPLNSHGRFLDNDANFNKTFGNFLHLLIGGKECKLSDSTNLK